MWRNHKESSSLPLFSTHQRSRANTTWLRSTSESNKTPFTTDLSRGMRPPVDAPFVQNMAGYTYHPTSPPHYSTSYYYSTSASTSPSPDNRTFYPPQYQNIPIITPGVRRTSAHARAASFSTPLMSTWTSPSGYPAQAFYPTQPIYSAPQPVYEHVSTSEHIKSKARRFSMSGNAPCGNCNPKRRASVRSQTHRIYVDDVDEAVDPPVYTYRRPRPKDSHQAYQRTAKANSHFFFNQVPDEEVYESRKTSTRPRRASQPTKARPSPPRESPPRETKAKREHRQATKEDRLRYNIGPKYSTRDWDPTERPIILLGSVFDANSIGKYIYDWTIAHYKAGSPMSEVAGDLWVLLIKFAGKMKRAEAGISRIRSKTNRMRVQEFINDGQKIWAMLERQLDKCEEYMWECAKKNKETGATVMDPNAGSELVKGLFGRDRRLGRTEKLMQQLRNWTVEFEGTRATDSL